MTFVVGSPCVGCKDTECVSICPVDCFYEGPNMLVIDPDECIDCALCEPVCPVNAIWADDRVPEKEIPFIEINAVNAKMELLYKNIVDLKTPLAEVSPYTLEEAIEIIELEV